MLMKSTRSRCSLGSPVLRQGSKIDENRQIEGSRHRTKGQKKTGGRQKGSRNKRTQEREEATAQAIALIGEAIPDAFAGDAHAFLVAVYKNPRIDHHTRQDAAKAALPYEKPRLQAVTLADEGGEPLKMRSELETGRRLAFVLELIARGEVKAKMPEPSGRQNAARYSNAGQRGRRAAQGAVRARDPLQ